jgi:hypothetical protein
MQPELIPMQPELIPMQPGPMPKPQGRPVQGCVLASSELLILNLARQHVTVVAALDSTPFVHGSR